MFTAALFTVAKTQKQSMINKRMDKEDVGGVCVTEHYSGIKNEIMPSA